MRKFSNLKGLPPYTKVATGTPLAELTKNLFRTADGAVQPFWKATGGAVAGGAGLGLLDDQVFSGDYQPQVEQASIGLAGGIGALAGGALGVKNTELASKALLSWLGIKVPLLAAADAGVTYMNTEQERAAMKLEAAINERDTAALELEQQKNEGKVDAKDLAWMIPAGVGAAGLLYYAVNQRKKNKPLEGAIGAAGAAAPGLVKGTKGPAGRKGRIKIEIPAKALPPEFFGALNNLDDQPTAYTTANIEPGSEGGSPDDPLAKRASVEPVPAAAQQQAGSEAAPAAPVATNPLANQDLIKKWNARSLEDAQAYEKTLQNWDTNPTLAYSSAVQETWKAEADAEAYAKAMLEQDAALEEGYSNTAANKMMQAAGIDPSNNTLLSMGLNLGAQLTGVDDMYQAYRNMQKGNYFKALGNGVMGLVGLVPGLGVAGKLGLGLAKGGLAAGRLARGAKGLTQTVRATEASKAALPAFRTAMDAGKTTDTAFDAFKGAQGAMLKGVATNSDDAARLSNISRDPRMTTFLEAHTGNRFNGLPLSTQGSHAVGVFSPSLGAKMDDAFNLARDKSVLLPADAGLLERGFGKMYNTIGSRPLAAFDRNLNKSSYGPLWGTAKGLGVGAATAQVAVDPIVQNMIRKDPGSIGPGTNMYWIGTHLNSMAGTDDMFAANEKKKELTRQFRDASGQAAERWRKFEKGNPNVARRALGNGGKYTTGAFGDYIENLRNDKGRFYYGRESAWMSNPTTAAEQAKANPAFSFNEGEPQYWKQYQRKGASVGTDDSAAKPGVITQSAQNQVAPAADAAQPVQKPKGLNVKPYNPVGIFDRGTRPVAAYNDPYNEVERDDDHFFAWKNILPMVGGFLAPQWMHNPQQSYYQSMMGSRPGAVFNPFAGGYEGLLQRMSTYANPNNPQLTLQDNPFQSHGYV